MPHSVMINVAILQCLSIAHLHTKSPFFAKMYVTETNIGSLLGDKMRSFYHLPQYVAMCGDMWRYVAVNVTLF